VGRIRILDETLANQIAAGEVVERPASVAKELLENALDAGATAITVEVAEGGVRRLRVVDNGSGMGREDAVLALQRHATSKVARADDLLAIRTLGFRGEALPSIASVSRFSLRSREPEALGGTRVRLEGGGEPKVEEAGCPVGTEVLVEDLFFNVPARRKFLKKAETEAAHVQEAVERLAVAHPHVAFRFVRDGRTVIDVPRHESLLDRARSLFDDATAAALQPIRLDGLPGVDGLLGDPRAARATSRHLYTYVNGRFVRDRVVMSAVQSACGSKLERGRYPFVVLRLTLPPEAVDVNVHPAKTEVRFVDGSNIHRLVHRAVQPLLEADPWRAPPEAPAARTYTLSAPEPAPAPEAGLDAHRRRVFDVMERLANRRAGPAARTPVIEPLFPPSALDPRPRVEPWTPPEPAARIAEPSPDTEVAAPGPSARVAEPPTADAPTDPPPAPSAEARAVEPARGRTTSGERSAAPRPAPPVRDVPIRGADSLPTLGARPDPAALPFPALRPLGLLAGRLLLCAAADGLVGLDLPAAHRRLAYDRLCRGAPSIPLAAPAVVTLAPDEWRRFSAARPALAEAGVEAEPFGGTTAAVKALPAGIAEPDAEAFLRAALHLEILDPPALRVLAAEFAAAAEAPPTAASMPAFLAALAAVRHAPPRPEPFVLALGLAELERRLVAGPPG
jgi:DNA mismatch repair protein MutL